MPSFPEVEETLAAQGLGIYGILVEDRAEASAREAMLQDSSNGSTVVPASWQPLAGPSLEEVRGYLEVRRVVATIRNGTDSADKAIAVVNIAVFAPEGGSAVAPPESPDEAVDLTHALKVTVASAEDGLAQGQTIHEFLSGMAHALGTTIGTQSGLRFSPSGDDPALPFEEEKDFGDLTRSLSVITGGLPVTAYESLFNSDGTGSYGLCEGYQVVLPDTGYVAFPFVAEDESPEIPAFVFSKMGQVRRISMHFEDVPYPSLSIFIGTGYEAVGSYAPDSPAGKVVSVLKQGLQMEIDDELPKRPKKSNKPQARQLRRAYEAFDLLTTNAPDLVNTPTDQVFAKAAALLDLPAPIQSALVEFERLGADDRPRALGGIPLTEVDAAPEGSRILHSMHTVLATYRSGEKLKDGRGLRQLSRSRQGVLALACLALVGAVAIATVIAVPAFSEYLDVSGFGRVIGILPTLGLGFAAYEKFSALRHLGEARALLRKAHSDGVFPYPV